MILHIMRSSGESMINLKHVQQWLEIAGRDDWLGVWWLGGGNFFTWVLVWLELSTSVKEGSIQAFSPNCPGIRQKMRETDVAGKLSEVKHQT